MAMMTKEELTAYLRENMSGHYLEWFRVHYYDEIRIKIDDSHHLDISYDEEGKEITLRDFRLTYDPDDTTQDVSELKGWFTPLRYSHPEFSERFEFALALIPDADCDNRAKMVLEECRRKVSEYLPLCGTFNRPGNVKASDYDAIKQMLPETTKLELWRDLKGAPEGEALCLYDQDDNLLAIVCCFDEFGVWVDEKHLIERESLIEVFQALQSKNVF